MMSGFPMTVGWKERSEDPFPPGGLLVFCEDGRVT